MYEIGKMAISSSTIYIYKSKDGNYVVGVTTPRQEIFGESIFDSQEDAKKDFLETIKADKEAYDYYTAQGVDYPESPV